MNNEQYFATLEGSELIAELNAKVRQFLNSRSSLEQRWRRNYRFYYNQHNNEHMGWGATSLNAVELVGEQGELVKVSINQFRNILLHVLNLITGAAPAFQARATNDDAASLSKTRLANSILDFLMTDKDLEDIFETAVEHSLIFDSGYIKVEWDSQAGDPIALDFNEAPIYSGDIKFSNPTAWDIVFDINKTQFRDNDWIIHRTHRNKYELAAQYPELKEKIYAACAQSDTNNVTDTEMSNDDIEVFEFFHKRIPSLMPEGRYVQYCGEECVLVDVGLPYYDIPIYQVSPGDDLASQFGYSVANDIAPIQEMINSEYSTIMSNHEAFGVQQVGIPREANVNVKEISGGMQIVEYDITNGGGAPHGLNLTQTPVEIFQMLDHLVGDMETISGINSVVRGNPEASLKSGTALALVQNQALAYMNKLQKSYKHLMESVGTGAIRVFQMYANTERTISIVGKHHQSGLRTFKGEDLNEVKQVTVEMGNPLSRTVAGRIELAQQLINTGLIKTPEEYINVVETGELTSLTESVVSQLTLIRKENEDLLEGVGARALLVDDHRLHILEHATVLGDPQMRADLELSNMVLSHLQEHLQFLNHPGATQLLGLLGYTGMSPMPGPGPSGAAMDPNANATPDQMSQNAAGGVDPAMMQAPGPGTVPGQQAPSPANMPSPPPGAMTPPGV